MKRILNVNIIDIVPFSAGLIFGAPAGIIAGLIGGIYRFVAVYFELAGTYTQIACSVSTILAGFIAAILRKRTVMIPRGYDLIREGDSVVVVSRHKALKDISDIIDQKSK